MKGNTMPNGDRPPLGNLDDDYGGHWRISEKELEEGRRQAEKRPLLPRQMRESDTPEKSKEWKGNTMLVYVFWNLDSSEKPLVVFLPEGPDQIKKSFEVMLKNHYDNVRVFLIEDIAQMAHELGLDKTDA